MDVTIVYENLQIYFMHNGMDRPTKNEYKKKRKQKKE